MSHTIWAERLNQSREKQFPASSEQHTRKIRKPNKTKNTLQTSSLLACLSSLIQAILGTYEGTTDLRSNHISKRGQF